MHEPLAASAELPGGATASDTVEPPSVRTGVGAVDAVLVAVEQLDDVAVSEHAAVYEQAHDALRRALDAPADD